MSRLGNLALCVVSGCSLARGSLGSSRVDGASPDDAYVAPMEDGGVDAFAPPGVDAGHDRCGDGTIAASETCDDGNTRDGDGCSADCLHVESGFHCSGSPSMCATTCGDGIRAGSEACDGGPGCTACMVDGMQVVMRGSGLALAIPDDHYDGSQGSMTCVDLVVVQYPRDRVASVEVGVGMRHTYVGDLTIKLVSPAGTVVTLVSRPGLNEARDDGSDMGGDSSELDPGFPITFVTGATTSSESMGQPINGTQAVCRNDPTCSFAPSHGAAPAGDLTTFATETAHGTWHFCAADGAPGDTGSIDQVVLTLTLD